MITNGKLTLHFEGNPIAIERNIAKILNYIVHSDEVDLNVLWHKYGFFSLHQDRVVMVVSEIVSHHLDDIIGGNVNSLNNLYRSTTGHDLFDLDCDSQSRLKKELTDRLKELNVISEKIQEILAPAQQFVE